MADADTGAGLEGDAEGKGDTAIDEALEELPEEAEEPPRRHYPVPEEWIKKMHCMHWCDQPGGTRLCMRAFSCPCVLAGQNAQFAGNSYRWACVCQAACPCLHPLVTGPNRYQLKQVLGIVDKPRPSRFWDLCVHCWFPCCSVLQEHKEIIVRTEPGNGWFIQQGHLYMKPTQRRFDDALELVWEPKPLRPRKKKKDKDPTGKPPNLVIKRRRSIWSPVDHEQEFSTFYA